MRGNGYQLPWPFSTEPFSDWAAFIPIQVGGRARFDSAGMHRRVDDLLAAALRRT